MENGKDSIRALWVVQLLSECPHCGEDVDLLDYEDFWDGRDFQMGEHGTENTQDIEVDCPECNASFLVTLEY